MGVKRSDDTTPADRFRKLGPQALHDAELVALLLAATADGAAAVQAEALLAAFGDVPALINCNLENMRALDIGDDPATRLLAAIELGRRLVRFPSLICNQVELPAALRARLGLLDQHVMGAMLLREDNYCLGIVETYRGPEPQVGHFMPTALLREVICRNAAAMLPFHFWPELEPRPHSLFDDDLFRSLSAAAGLVGVDMNDLLLLGQVGWVSYRRMARC